MSQAAIEEVDLNVKVLVGLFETTCPSRIRSSRDRGWSESQLRMNVAQPPPLQQQQQRLCSSSRSLASKPPVPCADPGLPRLSRKLYGKTHPLDRLTPRQRHAHPVFGTMWACSRNRVNSFRLKSPPPPPLSLSPRFPPPPPTSHSETKWEWVHVSAIRWCIQNIVFRRKCLRLWVGAWDFQLQGEVSGAPIHTNLRESIIEVATQVLHWWPMWYVLLLASQPGILLSNLASISITIELNQD